MTSSDTYKLFNMDQVFFKGDTDITFDVSDISSGDFLLLRAIFIFESSSTPLVVEYGEINTSFTQSYTYIPPSGDEHSVLKYSAISTLLINKIDGMLYNWVYKIPIEISKTSFFSEHKTLKIIDCQFSNENTDETVCIFKNGRGTVLNLKLN